MSEKSRRLLGILLPAALLLGFLVLRLPGLGRYVTTDEALWLRRSANFYMAVSNGDWAKTYQSPHPGVVTLWAGAAGFWLEFPEYRHVGSEAIHDVQLLQLMENRSINPMQVLAAGRAALVLVHATVFLACWPFARRLLGLPAAALGMGLLAFDPFVIAHQRFLHLDGLLASFMLLALLAYLDYLRFDRWQSLLVSGIATGLAWLTKTPALFLAPALFALTLYFWWRQRRSKFPVSNLQSPISNYQLPRWLAFLIWLFVALAVVFILFPALWSNPVGIPLEMAGYALGSAEGEYSGPIFFNGDVYPEGDLGAAGWIFYPLSFLWRSTPPTLVGLGFSVWFFLFRHSEQVWLRQGVAKNPPAAKGTKQASFPNSLLGGLFASLRVTTKPCGQGIPQSYKQKAIAGKLAHQQSVEPSHYQTSALLFLFSLGFIFFMTIAGKKFDRYLLPALPPLTLIAGWGWTQLAARLKWFQAANWRLIALFAMVASLQLASALPTHPYYLSYYDPLMGGSAKAAEIMMVGWGEGLDQAADYINRQPDVEPGDVASWYSVSFNLMTSAAVEDIPIVLELSESELSNLLAKKYLVIYVHQWQRSTPQNLLDRLQGLEPEYRVRINGIEYVHVYRLDNEALTTGPHGDGVYQVGVSIASGLWRSTADQGEDGDCYWARRKYDGILLENHYAPSGSDILIRPTDYEVEFDGCGVWVYMGEG